MRLLMKSGGDMDRLEHMQKELGISNDTHIHTMQINISSARNIIFQCNLKKKRGLIKKSNNKRIYINMCTHTHTHTYNNKK